MVIAGIFILLFLLMVGILLVPVELCINTTSNQYYLQVKGLARASVEEDHKEVIRIRVRTFFRSFYFYPLRKIGHSKSREIGNVKSKKAAKESSR